MEIRDIQQTCYACPSQWEAKTEDGRGVYIRYRWGRLTIHVSHKAGEHGLDGSCVYSKQIGDEYDGVIPIEKVTPIIQALQLTPEV